MQMCDCCACKESRCIKTHNKKPKANKWARVFPGVRGQGFFRHHALQRASAQLCTVADSCGHWRRSVVAHEWLVVAGRRVWAMVHLPARVAVVAETWEVAAEVRAWLTCTHVTHRLLQVRVDLDLHAQTQTSRRSYRFFHAPLNQKYVSIIAHNVLQNST